MADTTHEDVRNDSKDVFIHQNVSQNILHNSSNNGFVLLTNIETISIMIFILSTYQST
jgi:hypothetical protein